MSTNWENLLIDRLNLAAHQNGGWGYARDAAPCAEPTALTCLALAARGVETDAVQKGLALLARLQRPDGSVSITLDLESPGWPTGLAVLSWSSSNSDAALYYRSQIKRAVDWILRSSGRSVASNTAVYGHDTTARGWPWVESTHAWVEPTAYAVLALRATGNDSHPRTQEGIRLVLDRAIPKGGWNYGNTRVYKNTLRPFPGPTGVALAALAGQRSDPRIEAGIAYLSHELRRVRSPLSLAWGLIGLAAWGRRPHEASAWLEECAQRALRSAPNAMYSALLLLADLDPCPITARLWEVAATNE